MKTSKLIAILQELDPTGEIEVTIDHEDISHADLQPGYYDGCYDILQYDDEGHINGVMVCSKQDKIRLYPCGYESLFYEYPDMIVEYDSEYSERYKKYVEEFRQKVKNEIADWDKE